MSMIDMSFASGIPPVPACAGPSVSAVTETSSLGSRTLVLRGTSADIAALLDRMDEWRGDAGRLFADVKAGLIALMAPSWPHENYGDGVGDLVKTIARVGGLPVMGGGSWTLGPRKSPKGGGLVPGDRSQAEPDACYIFGEKVLRARTAIAAGQKAVEDDFGEKELPDLVVEVDFTSASANKPAFYRSLGIPEMWRLRWSGPESAEALTVEILDLQAEAGPETKRAASALLPLCTPEFVVAALPAARGGDWEALDALVAEAVAAAKADALPEPSPFD